LSTTTDAQARAFDLINDAIWHVTSGHNHDALVVLTKLKAAWQDMQQETPADNPRRCLCGHGPSRHYHHGEAGTACRVEGCACRRFFGVYGGTS